MRSRKKTGRNHRLLLRHKLPSFKSLSQKYLSFITETFPVLVEKELFIIIIIIIIITKGFEFLSNILALKCYF